MNGFFRKIVNLSQSRLIRSKKNVYSFRFRVMGTFASITVVEGNLLKVLNCVISSFFMLHKIENLMSRFLLSSDVGRINESRVGEAVNIHPLTAEVLSLSIQWAEASEGKFDPCIGELTELWNIATRVIPPSPRILTNLAAKKSYTGIYLEYNLQYGWRVIKSRNVRVDLGGIAKGYGVDRVVTVLKMKKIENALVNVGGDLYALGRSERGTPWRIALRDPLNPERSSGYIDLENEAVAGSGDYYQYFQYSGRRYHHILNPDTAEPHETGIHGIYVRANDCVTADAAATTVFGTSDPTDVDSLLTQCPGNARIVTPAL